jgi:vitamin B12 transporter
MMPEKRFRLRSTVTLALLPIATWSSAAAAQEPPDTFRLNPIVVTATRLPQPRSAVPASVTVLRGEMLRAQGVRFVADALRLVAGTNLVRLGSRGGLTSLFMRGGESDYVQVMVDGVVLNEPGGAFDIGQLTTDNVERIEVVRGPASVLYGSDAVTGVVNVITRAASGPPRVSAAASISPGTTPSRSTDGREASTRGWSSRAALWGSSATSSRGAWATGLGARSWVSCCWARFPSS